MEKPLRGKGTRGQASAAGQGRPHTACSQPSRRLKRSAGREGKQSSAAPYWAPAHSTAHSAQRSVAQCSTGELGLACASTAAAPCLPPPPAGQRARLPAHPAASEPRPQGQGLRSSVWCTESRGLKAETFDPGKRRKQAGASEPGLPLVLHPPLLLQQLRLYLPQRVQVTASTGGAGRGGERGARPRSVSVPAERWAVRRGLCSAQGGTGACTDSRRSAAQRSTAQRAPEREVRVVLLLLALALALPTPRQQAGVQEPTGNQGLTLVVSVLVIVLARAYRCDSLAGRAPAA